MKITIGETQNVSVGNDHESEGVLFKMSNGNILHLYRQCPGGHTGNDGKIVKREYNVETGSWGSISDVFSDQYDDRNIHGGVTSTGRFVLFFRRYNASTSTTVDVNYIYSDDNGATWSSRATVSLGNSEASPYGDMIEIPGEGYMMGFQANYYVEVLFSSNGSSWGNRVVVGDYRSAQTYNITETSFVHIGNNKIIGLSRDNNRGMLYQVKSSDNGETWSTPVRSNVAKETFTVSPRILYIDGKMIVFAPDRRSVPGHGTRAEEGISFYIGDPGTVWNTPDAYEYINFKNRPLTSSGVNFYGYPSFALLKNNTFLVVFTDRYYIDSVEDANLYQFLLNVVRNGMTDITIDVAYSDYEVYPFDTTFTNIGDGLVRDGSAIKILKPCSVIRVQAGLNLDLASGENVQIQLRKNGNVQFLYDSGVANAGMLSIFTPSILISAQKNDLITMAFSCSVARTFSTRGDRSALIVEIIN